MRLTPLSPVGGNGYFYWRYNMKVLEMLIGIPLAIIWFLFGITIKIIFVVLGPFIGAPAVYYSYKKKLPVLPWWAWPYRNLQEAYTTKGPDCKDIINDKGNWHWENKVVKEGWSQLKFFMYWTLLRNPARRLTHTRLNLNIEKVSKIVYSFNSLTKYDSKVIGGRSIHHWWSPIPWRLRLISNKFRYWDISLVRSGWLYYFMVRMVKVYSPQEYVRRKWYAPWKKESLGIQKRHREFIMGSKCYWFMLHYNDIDHEDAVRGILAYRNNTINYVYREDKDWA